MLDYLIEREKEEMFRTSTREVEFPDGKTLRIETYRLVWTWFDKAIAYEHVPDRDWILNTTLEWAEEKRMPIADALGQLLNFMVREAENDGADFTDDNLPLIIIIARQRMEKFHARKEKR